MYPFKRSIPRVRDRAARYGGAHPAQDPSPAAAALRDLSAAEDHAIPLVLARYAALRSWQLAMAGAPAALADHGRDAARGYLAATPDGWAEKEPLGRLVAQPLPAAEAAALLAAVAVHAAALGHAHGAGEARRSAERAAAAGG